MAIKNLHGKPKRNRVVERLKNRILPMTLDERKEKDVKIIDVALKSLYNDGGKVARSLKQEILEPSRIKISEKEAERIWNIMLSTGLINPVIGFGNSGKLTLTNEGYQLMTQYGSYSAFLEEREQQRQDNAQGIMFPQFVIGTEEKDPGEGGGQKAVGKKKGEK